MGISSSGLVSGINFDQLVQQVQDSQRKPVVVLQTRQADYQKQISAVLTASTKLSTLLAVSSSINNPANFNTNSVTVGNTSLGATLLSATTTADATPGSYSVGVKQLAQSHKVASQGFVDQNSTAVASASGTLKFKVGGAGTEYSVTVSAGTTLQGLRDTINAASGSVTATIINDGTGSNPYRLILTAKSSGASNTISITSNDTTLDFTNKKVEQAYASSGNAFAGTVTSNAGNNYTGTTNKTFIVQIVSGGVAGVATYKYSVDGGITYLGANGAAYDGTNAITTQNTLTDYIDGAATTNGVNENVQLSFGAGTLSASDTFTVDVFNPTFQSAQDAVITVDGTTFTKQSNSISDVIQGVTLNLTQADTTHPVNVNITSDSSKVVEKLKNFATAYNEFNAFLNQQLSYDPTVKTAGPLLGDPTLRSLQSLIRNIVSGPIPGLTSGTANLSQIGITSNSKTGELKVDEGKLAAAVTNDPAGIRRLFLGIGTPSNSAIQFVGVNAKTVAGRYGVTIGTAPQKAVLGGTGDVTFQDLSTTGLTSAESLSFSFSSNYTAASPATTSFSVTLAAGSRINEVVNALNSVFSTKGVALSASNDSGRLKITSKDYGADVRFTVVSDQAGTTQTGIGSVGRTAQGADIAGTINDHSATGKGNVLTSNSGFAEDGLAISTESTTTGLFGSVTVTRGVGDRLTASLGAYTDPSKGILASKSNILQGNVDRIQNDITRINDRITAEGDRFRTQLVQLESLLAKFQSTSNFLAQQLAKLPTVSS